MNQLKRYNLNVRLQPIEGSPLAEVVEWFNQMPRREKNQKISQILLMTCLPLARAKRGVVRTELERCYWEFEDWFYQHKFIVKDELKIQGKSEGEGNWTRFTAEPMVQTQESARKEMKVTSSTSHLLGQVKVKNAGSIFDGLG